MSTTPLSNSIELVERSLFHSIRKELVDKGYLPDIKAKTEVSINLVNQGLKQFRASGNLTTQYSIGRKFDVIESTGNNGVYTIAAVAFASGNTTITTIEAIPNATANGKVSIYTYYDDSVGVIAFKTALTSIITSKGFCIEIFGASNPQAKYLKKVPRIVILPNQRLPGGLGGQPDKVYTPNNGDVLNPDAFTEKTLPPQTADFTYDFHLVANTAQQSRVLHAIVALAIPKMGYVNYYNDETKKIFVNHYSYRSIPNTQEGIIEDIYMYRICDIFETEDVIGRDDIKPIVEIKIDTKEGTENKSTDFNVKTID